jgi:hypothetical protein
LGGVREQDPVVDGDDFQGAFLDPPVAAVVLSVGDGYLGSGQPSELFSGTPVVFMGGFVRVGVGRVRRG